MKKDDETQLFTFYRQSWYCSHLFSRDFCRDMIPNIQGHVTKSSKQSVMCGANTSLVLTTQLDKDELTTVIMKQNVIFYPEPNCLLNVGSESRHRMPVSTQTILEHHLCYF